jgi:hypothetical protein
LRGNLKQPSDLLLGQTSSFAGFTESVANFHGRYRNRKKKRGQHKTAA